VGALPEELRGKSGVPCGGVHQRGPRMRLRGHGKLLVGQPCGGVHQRGPRFRLRGHGKLLVGQFFPVHFSSFCVWWWRRGLSEFGAVSDFAGHAVRRFVLFGLAKLTLGFRLGLDVVVDAVAVPVGLDRCVAHVVLDVGVALV